MRKFLLFPITYFCLFLIGCENPLEERLNELEDEVGVQKELINSLIDQIYTQQSIIDSLHNRNREYSDSLYSEIDTLISNQNKTIQLLISSLPSTGEDYIRIDSLQICWGGGFAGISGSYIEFPVVFIEPPKVFITSLVKQDLSGVTNITTTRAKFYSYNDTNYFISYCAMGRWK